MTGSKSLLTGLMLLGVAALSSSIAQERPVLTPEQLARVQIQPVAGKEGLYIIPGFDGSLSGGNVAVLVTGEGVIVVDNKFPYSYEDIASQVAKVTSEPIKYV